MNFDAFLKAIDFDMLSNLIPQMLKASLVTVEIFFLTLALSIPLGFIVCFGRMSRNVVIREIIKFYLLIMRGTPLILQLIFFYFAPASLFGITIPRFWAAILAFVLNYAAYFCEIFRSGIESIPVGQHEAAFILGFNKSQTFFRISLPQVVKRILPPMGSECMTLVKDTALAQTIGVAEMFRLAQTATTREFSIVPIFVAGIFYLVMNSLVSIAFNKMEKSLSYYD